MSRHRDIRNMDYTDDYNGYDDIYGHSVDDDYYISPSNRQFIYNRENSRDQPKIGEFIRTEQDIQEEEENTSGEISELTDLEKAQLESCLDQIQSTLDSLRLPKNEVINIAIAHNFNPEQTIDAILKEEHLYQRQETGSGNNPKKFVIPKLNGLNPTQSPLNTNMVQQFNIPPLQNKFVIPKLTTNTAKFTIPKLNNRTTITNNETPKFNNLSDLVTNHLSKSLKGSLSITSNNDCDKKIPTIISDMDRLKITKDSSKLLNSPQSSSSSSYKIDLSAAIKTTNTPKITINKKTNNQNNDFVIPFIDCDINVKDQRNILPCRWNCSDILQVQLKYRKNVSNLGRVICWKFRTNKRLFRFDDFDDVIVKNRFKLFKFDTPSPDDLISKHLKR